MNVSRNFYLRTASRPVLAVAAVATLFAASTSVAQDATVVAEEDVEAAPDIIVTGSRIVRPELSQPNPVQVLDSVQIEQSGQTNLTEFLADQPALLGSQTISYLLIAKLVCLLTARLA